ncbi:MAG TPA: type II toxin-antitoxin system prevent-host-death family antitoxin [Chloroflexota bacterium]|nr:type II toxin-antitoxin system prevent-host-death family antitoxin [Chloroflexota bacterium]
MATKIGVRELRDHASQILRRVAERGERFEVCKHNKVVARLEPAEEPDRKKQWDEWFEEFQALGREISAHLDGPTDSVAMIREERAPYGERDSNSGY